jgi:putative ubiquitin-RnfH superfamily antitoxin RatB of RatAB toxin-antitoxin module
MGDEVPGGPVTALAGTLHVQVCYATDARVILRDVVVAAETTIEQAIGQSGLLDELPGLDLATHPVGLYSRKKSLDTVLRERDRIEIYRPLVADPKNARRRRPAV